MEDERMKKGYMFYLICPEREGEKLGERWKNQVNLKG